MQTTKHTITLAIGAVLGLSGLAGGASAADVRCAEQERCYGVSKAGKNDCATSSAACSGSATQDFQKDAWVYVPKGSCARLAGGTLATPTSDMKK
ncbi:MAG: DUF2282 domain-containing protein [Gammaproteobacteria bacterium]|nr:DUF2282 domain-containing protein [Gammaproteobacteria bacterium]